jgi:hypothetical protein
MRRSLCPAVICALSLCAEPYRASLSHIEGKGIGYRHGYTSLDLFFSRKYNNSLPFIDLRGHLFDDGKCAANAGLGFRYIYPSVIFGGNFFYDMRNTNHAHFNQIGAGFETIGEHFDFRVNGYLPLGRTSRWYGHSFGGFSGHHLLIRRKNQFAMPGIDAEAGYLSDAKKGFTFYGGIGPYYYGAKGENAWGGKARIDISYKNYITLEGSASYDTVFKDIYQGQITFSLPFGPGSDTCSNQRSTQKVHRNEIIVTDHRDKNFVAIDPATNEPYYFLFINNESHSNGTFESPYPMLSTAIDVSLPHDIFYIYPGDGSAQTTDIGFVLQDGQQMLGAGFAYDFPTTLGVVRVPALATGRPYLTTDMALSVIIPANQNTIAGLLLETTNDTEDLHGCIYTEAPTADLSIFDNLIETNGGNGSGSGIYVALAGGMCVIENNTFDGTSQQEGVDIRVGTATSVAITHNTVSNALATAIGVVKNTSDTQTTLFTISNNTIANSSDTSILASNTSPGNAIFHILSNSITGGTGFNGIVVSNGSGDVCLRFQDNFSSGGMNWSLHATSMEPFYLEPFVGNTPNTYDQAGMGTITPVPQGTCD